MAITNFVAKALVLDKNSNFLLLTRSDTHPTLAGFYDLPGGRIEDLEEPGRAVSREIREETGLIVQPDNLKVMYAVTMFINGKSYPTLLYATRVNDEAPVVTLSYEHKAFEWADIERLPEVEPHLASTYRQALEYIRTNGIIEDLGI